MQFLGANARGQLYPISSHTSHICIGGITCDIRLRCGLLSAAADGGMWLLSVRIKSLEYVSGRHIVTLLSKLRISSSLNLLQMIRLSRADMVESCNLAVSYIEFRAFAVSSSTNVVSPNALFQDCPWPISRPVQSSLTWFIFRPSVPSYKPKPGADYTAPTITIDNNPLKVTDKFTYLCSTTQNALIDDEISARIGKASGSFGKLTKRLWSERGVRLVTKINVYCAVVLPTLLYGCEVWTPYRRHIRRLDQFHMRCLRRIANIKWQDMIPNTEVLQRCTQTGIEQHIKRAQLRWSGHLVRMADDRIPKDVFYGELDAGHRTRGGQRKRYKDVLNSFPLECMPSAALIHIP